jgi:hypothetical protein
MQTDDSAQVSWADPILAADLFRDLPQPHMELSL